ncbi:MAG: 50S ribosomal protein L30 [Spirochaetia bacterium]|nr:50S ribosomal protein L30 [Spirochaetia bacterium]
MSKEKKVKITQIKSCIGRTDRQINTLKGLGLGRIGKSREHKITPQISGMINKVNFLVSVEELN